MSSGADASWADDSWGDDDAATSTPLVDDELSVVDEAGDVDQPDGDGPESYYSSVDEFVREYLISTYRRSINGRTRVWAARWWEYPEAIIRLEALWRAWEDLRLEPTVGMSVWLREHADHHMPILMDPDGPFAGADPDDTANQSGRGQPLPYKAPPPGLFDDDTTGNTPTEGDTP